VRHILILGALPDAARRAPLAAVGWRVVSTSPWLSAQLDSAGIAHRRAETYGPPATWPRLHAATARAVNGLAVRSHAAPDGVWLDDWSHLIVDELSEQIFWEGVARGLLRVERPRAIHVQRIDRASSASGPVTALARALDALGRPCAPWPP
jgi:hypothetical protein